MSLSFQFSSLVTILLMSFPFTSANSQENLSNLELAFGIGKELTGPQETFENDRTLSLTASHDLTSKWSVLVYITHQSYSFNQYGGEYTRYLGDSKPQVSVSMNGVLAMGKYRVRDETGLAVEQYYGPS